MVRDSRRVPQGRRAAPSSSTPSTSSTATRRTPTYALEVVRGGSRGGRRRDRAVRHQRRHAAARGRARSSARSRRALDRAARHPRAQRRRLRCGQLARRRRRRLHARPGHHERLRRARRQRRPHRDHPGARAQDGRRLRHAPTSCGCSPRSATSSPRPPTSRPNPHQPYVGASAFAHKGGVHASAADRLPEAYEHVDPGAVGNLARVVVSELAGTRVADDEGRGARHRPVGRPGDGRARVLDADQGPRVPRLLASRPPTPRSRSCCARRLGTYEPFFALESFRCIMEKREDGRVMTEATIKVHVGGQRYIATAEGNGPVNALDKALRIAIGRFYPRPGRASSSPTTRSACSTRRRAPAPSRACSSSPTTASRAGAPSASRRTSSRRRGRRSSTRSSTGSRTAGDVAAE